MTQIVTVRRMRQDDSMHTAGPPPPPRAPGIKDVAAIAGVSWKTVSNVVHNRPNVRPATRTRVEAAIAQLGYRPSLAGRQLRRGRTDTLALALPEIVTPYFGAVAQTVIAAADEHGFSVLIDVTGGSPEREMAVAQGYRTRHIDGIIFSPLNLTATELAEHRDTTPMVLLGEHITGSGLDHVGIDNVGSAVQATEHLLARGRRRIAFLGVQPGGPSSTGDIRLEGYLQALTGAGLELEPGLVVTTTSYTRGEGELRVRELLAAKTKLDAIVCGNDLLAIGALKALREAGVDVPGQVGVVGWDGGEEGAFANPALTTIAPDVDAIARLAVAALVDRIEGSTLPATELVAPHRLVARLSSAR